MIIPMHPPLNLKSSILLVVVKIKVVLFFESIELYRSDSVHYSQLQGHIIVCSSISCKHCMLALQCQSLQKSRILMTLLTTSHRGGYFNSHPYLSSIYQLGCDSPMQSSKAVLFLKHGEEGDVTTLKCRKSTSQCTKEDRTDLTSITCMESFMLRSTYILLVLLF